MQGRRKTTEEFKEEVHFMYPNDEYFVLSDYINSKTLIEFIHNECGNKFMKIPDNFLSGQGCPICAKKTKIKVLTKTQEQFEGEVHLMHPNNEYSILGNYINAITPIEFIHNECGNKFMKIPNNFLRGQGCPICARKRRTKTKTKTQEQFEGEVHLMYPNNEYFILGNYINQKTPIEFIHNECGNKFMKIPSNFLSGQGCPICAKKTQIKAKTKTQEQFEEEIHLMYPNDEYSVLGDYINSRTSIEFIHNECGNRFFMISNDFLKGHGCPICCNCKNSKGVKAIRKYFKEKNIFLKEEYKFNDLKDKDFLRYDFAIFSNNKLISLIEFDGGQHFKPKDYFGGINGFYIRLNHDIMKTNYCDENQIPLLRIKYTQLKDINEILNDFIDNPDKYIRSHYYGLTEEEYYSECYEDYAKESLAN